MNCGAGPSGGRTLTNVVKLALFPSTWIPQSLIANVVQVRRHANVTAFRGTQGLFMPRQQLSRRGQWKASDFRITPARTIETRRDDDTNLDVPSGHIIAPTADPTDKPQAHNAKPKTLSLCQSIQHTPNEGIAITSIKDELLSMAASKRFFERPCSFLYSAERLHHHSQTSQLPEIVVLGASNVGKSSMLNRLVNSASMARVSPKPGKTTLMNAFGIGPPSKDPWNSTGQRSRPPKHSLVLVDTPGYGYRSQANWGLAVLDYLNKRKTLQGAVLLLSTDKPIRDEDRWMLQALVESNVRTVVVLTKADKSGDRWIAKCAALAESVQNEIVSIRSYAEAGSLDKTIGIYITGIGKHGNNIGGSGGGLGGVRNAILEMAGISVEDQLTQRDDGRTSYAGRVVPFDEIQWK